MSRPTPTPFFGSYPDLAAHLADRVAQRRAAGSERGALAATLAAPVEIVVPSSGAARLVTSRLLDRFPRGLAGVSIETLESLATRMLNDRGSYPRVATVEERRIATRLATRAIDHPLMQLRGAAGMTDRTFRDVRDHGITVAELERRLRLRPVDSDERLAVTIEAWKRSERTIASLRAVDPAEILERAAAAVRGDRGSPSRLIVFGFYDATGAQKKLLHALVDAGRIDSFFIPVLLDGNQPASSCRFAAEFVEAFAPNERISVPGVTPLPQPSFVFHPTDEAEMRETARAIRSALDAGVRAEAIGVVVRSVDPLYATRFARAAEEFHFTLASRPALPLKAHRIGRVLIALLTMRRRGFARRDVVEILASGLRAEALGVRIDPAATDAASRAAGLAGGDSASLARLLANREARGSRSDDAMALYLDAVRKIESWTPPAEVLPAGRWADLLDANAGRFSIATDDDLAAAAVVDDCIALLRRLGRAGIDLHTDDVVEVLASGAEIAPPPSDLAAVWFGDVMQLRGRLFDRLFVLRMQHDVFPQRRVEDPLLPDAGRLSLGLRVIGDGRAEEEMLFTIVTRSASGIVQMSAAANDSEGRALRPSPLLLQFALEHYPAERKEIYGDFAAWSGRRARHVEAMSNREREIDAYRRQSEPAPPHIARRIALLARVGTKSNYDGYLTVDGAVEALIRSRLAAVSPTRLERYGECPQQFLLNSIYGLREVEDPEHELQIELKKKGQLDHGVLERLYRELTESEIAETSRNGRPAAAVAERLERLVREAFQTHEVEHPAINPTLRMIERSLTLAFLSDFVAADLADLAESGFRPAAFELRFGGPGEKEGASESVPIAAGGITMMLRGSIDRVDERAADGRVRVVDYKSGKARRQAGLRQKMEKGHALQLGLYALALAALRELDPARVSGLIRPLRLPNGNASKFSFELGEERATILALLDEMVSSMLAGRFPAFPSEDGCRSCIARDFCRTRHDPEQTLPLERFESAIEMLRGEP